jgi:hypothetical protein
MGRRFNDLTRVEDVYQPHPVLATGLKAKFTPSIALDYAREF